ncbi:MAG: PAS domain S-box protein [Deltaproteobacteria bacterium]|nr:PAS domain S-box protein [Deltaproteobacteria bacterium]
MGQIRALWAPRSELDWRRRLVVGALLVGCVTCVFALISVFVVEDLGQYFVIYLTVPVILVAGAATLRLGHIRLAGAIMSVGAFIGLTAGIVATGGERSGNVASFMVVITLAGLLWDARAAVLIAVAAAITVMATVTMQQHGLLPPPIDVYGTRAWFDLMSLYLTTALLVFMAVGTITRAIDSAQLHRQRAEQVIADSPDAIVTASLEGVITTFNRTAEKLSGLDAEQVIGHHVSEYSPFGLESRERALEAVAGLVPGESVPPLELEVVQSDGTPVWVEANARIIERDNGTFLETIFRDISDRKDAHSQREELEGRLLQAQRLESLGRLAGGVAHDFNNLLTVLVANSHALLDSPNLSESDREMVEESRSAAESGAALTRQLLAFGRRQMLELAPLNLNDTIRNVKPLIERLVKEDSALEIDLQRSAGSVMADAVQLEQILVNLVANANDATPKGGTITVRSRSIELEEGRKTPAEGLSPGPYVCLQVIDTGTGMDESTVQRIFEPFYTTKPVGQGTGLGLATVHGVVAQSGGAVTVDSKPGRGTTFSIYLPRLAEGGKRAKQSDKIPMIGGNHCVLVVDDERAVLQVVSRVLKRAGYEVLSCADSSAVLSLVRDRGIEPKLLVSDVVMPQVSGPELATQLRELFPEMRVILASGYTDLELDGDALPSGSLLLHKPFSPKALLRKVYEALSQEHEPGSPAPAAETSSGRE